jgi:predicted metal-dependent phosphoesterase TrpH
MREELRFQRMIDLHLHSTWSDGRLTPTEVVKRAAEQGLQAIAIADHDVVGGTDEALEAGRRFGVEVIPAIELTVSWGRRVVHLLGYGIDHIQPLLSERLDTAERAMSVHVDTLLSELHDQGHLVSHASLVRAHSRYPTGTSVVLALTRERRLGQLKNPWKILRRAAQQPVTASVQDAIELIHRVGGAAVLAHPGKIIRGGPLLDADQLRPLVSAGLDGIECWSMAHRDATRDHFLGVADQLGIVVTGGSDSHGRDGGVAIGSQGVPRSRLEELTALISRCGVVQASVQTLA